MSDIKSLPKDNRSAEERAKQNYDNWQQTLAACSRAENRVAELESKVHLWESLGVDAASMLEEIARTRIPHTMTEHRAAEIVRENNAALSGLAVRIRGLLDGS